MSKDNQKPAPAPAVDAAKAPVTTAFDAAKESRSDRAAFEAAMAPSPSEVLARAEAELAEHQAAVERMRKAAGAAAFRGTKTYVVGPGKHYRKGKMYEPGELITVTDEKPGKDWVLYDPNAVKAVEVPAPVAAAGRASDQDVA